MRVNGRTQATRQDLARNLIKFREKRFLLYAKIRANLGYLKRSIEVTRVTGVASL
jgi:hypothetical protein